MTHVLDHLALSLDRISGGLAPSSRSEPRSDELRIVEYTPFPRVKAGELPRVGFTRDLSPSGLCVGGDRSEPVGALLRVVVRGPDGRPDRPCVTRVVWCEATSDGRHWLGLERL